jgi:phage terminase large subunit-like protein
MHRRETVVTKTAALDPVTQYATDVVARRIVACRLVTMACQRHLHDLRDAETKGLEWRPADAQEAIDFFPSVLCLPEETDVDEDAEADVDVMPEAGTPFTLSAFQQFIVGSLFGWFTVRISDKTGARRVRLRFRIAYVETGKGSGKTPLFAGLLLYMLVRHGVRGAQLFCAAVTKDQAKIAFTDCVKMVHASPALQAKIKETGNNLAVVETGSFIRPISAEKRGLDGKRVQGAVVEELHEHPSDVVAHKLRAGIKGRPDALILFPTNSGFDRESVCWEYHEYSRQVLERTLVNEAWFAFVCHLDSCATCYAKGHLQPQDDCPRCDDWKVEGPHWLKPNPNLGVSISWQYLRDEVRLAIDLPSQRNMTRRLNFCQWTDQLTVFITAEAWAGCATPLTRAAFLASLEGRSCVLGIDLSDKIDLSSVVCTFPRALDRERAPGAAAGGSPDVDDDVEAPPDRPTLDCAVDVLPYFWMPAKTLARRAQEDKIPYPEWEHAGWITTWPGSLIDHDAIVAFIIDVLAKTYRIRAIGIDNAGASGVVSKLKREFGDEVVQEIPQSFSRLSEPTKLLEALVATDDDGRSNLTHDGNPCLAWCLNNMGIEENAWREIRPIKLTQRKRIDGGVALIDGLERLGATEDEDPVDGPLVVAA